jgi:hypothetical protein
MEGVAYLLGYADDKREGSITLTFGLLAQLRSARMARGQTGPREDDEGGSKPVILGEIVTPYTLLNMKLWSEGKRPVATSDRADPEADFSASGPSISTRANLEARDMNHKNKGRSASGLPDSINVEDITVTDIEKFKSDNRGEIDAAVEQMLLQVAQLIAKKKARFVRIISREKAPGFKATMVDPSLQTDFSRYSRIGDPSRIDRLAAVAKARFTLDTPILMVVKTQDQGQVQIHTELRNFFITLKTDVSREKINRHFLAYEKKKSGTWAKSNNPFYTFVRETTGEAQQWFVTQEDTKYMSAGEKEALRDKKEQTSCLTLDTKVQLRTLKKSFSTYSNTLYSLDATTRKIGTFPEKGTGAMPYLLDAQLSGLDATKINEGSKEGSERVGFSVKTLTDVRILGATSASAINDLKFGDSPVVDAVYSMLGSLSGTLINLRLAVPVNDINKSVDGKGDPYSPARIPPTADNEGFDFSLVSDFVRKQVENKNSIMLALLGVITRAVQTKGMTVRVTKVDRLIEAQDVLDNIEDKMQKTGRITSAQEDYTVLLSERIERLSDPQTPESERFYYKTTANHQYRFFKARSLLFTH